MGLSLIVLVLAIGINTWLVINAPEPSPSGYNMAEAVQALKTGEAKLANGRTLKAETVSEAPDFVKANPEHRSRSIFSGMVAQRLASDLGVPPDRVWVSMRQMRLGGMWHRRHFDDNGDHGPWNGGFGPGGNPGGPPGYGLGGPGGFGPGGPGGNTNPGEAGAPASPGASGQGAPASADAPHGGDAQSGASPVAAGADRPPEQFQRERDRDQAMLRFMQSDERGHAALLYPAFSAAWKQADGTYRVIQPPVAWIQPWQERLLIGFGITALLILPLAWLLSQRLSKPIVAFSEAAAKVGFEDNSPPVLAVGPREVRAAADVLNAMQARIKKQVESRTALMGAIAHDLKTPLARMRLRIEELPAKTRDKLAADIADMDGLIRSAMSFTSAHKLRETLKPLDLSSLMETLAEDLIVTCPMESPMIEDGVMVNGDTVALKRIITNLVENACRYAGGCRIELATRGKEAEVSVVDHGPGLPPESMDAVFEPFYRLESSRNRDTGGSGLGLSVARALAEAQGGTLTLHNRLDGDKVTGLVAKLTLPLRVPTKK